MLATLLVPPAVKFNVDRVRLPEPLQPASTLPPPAIVVVAAIAEPDPPSVAPALTAMFVVWLVPFRYSVPLLMVVLPLKVLPAVNVHEPVPDLVSEATFVPVPLSLGEADSIPMPDPVKARTHGLLLLENAIEPPAVPRVMEPAVTSRVALAGPIVNSLSVD